MSSSPKSNQPSISRWVNRFGLKFLQINFYSFNVFLSPLSIGNTMVMLMNGAKNETYEEIKSVLGCTQELDEINEEWSKVLKTVLENSGNNKVGVGSKLLAKSGINVQDQFKSRLQSFDADIDLKHDDIINKINEWLKQKTDGMLQLYESELDDEIYTDPMLTILTATYFHGAWATLFNEKNTEKDIFYNEGITRTEVAMMSQIVLTRFGHFEELAGFKILELAYEHGKESTESKFKMLILLPDWNEGLEDLIEYLDMDKLDRYINEMREFEVDVHLPRFKSEVTYFFKKYPFEKLGMTRAFYQESADLSGITGNKDLFVTWIADKMAIEVDEKSASTATPLSDGKSEVEFVDFVANHPFLYFIIDDTTGVMLFTGAVVKL